MLTYKTSKKPLLFVPSLTGSIIYVLIMGLAIGLHQLSGVARYLQVPRSFSVFHLLTGGLDRFLTHAIGRSATATVVVGLFWALIGLAVYLFLQGVSRFIVEVSEGWDARGYLWPKGADRNRSVLNALQRGAFRVIAAMGLLVVTFGPLQRILADPFFVSWTGQSAVVRCVAWLLAAYLVLLLWTILLRLVLLRPRLFN